MKIPNDEWKRRVQGSKDGCVEASVIIVTMEDRHRGALTERNDNETDDLPVDAAGSIERHADNVAVGHCEIENDVWNGYRDVPTGCHFLLITSAHHCNVYRT